VHSSTGLYAHITWATKYRGRDIGAPDVPLITGSVLAAAARQKVHVIAQAVLSDHVHVVVSFLPDASLSAFIRDAKSESARRVNLEPGRSLRWQRGFDARSVCWGHLRAARVYVANQFRRHPDRIPA
jgi:putative transposase